MPYKLSDCCSSCMDVLTEDEGTCCYICMKCLKPCNEISIKNSPNNTDIKPQIKEYMDAVESYVQYSREEVKVKTLVRNSYARLMKAKEGLRDMEDELLEIK